MYDSPVSLQDLCVEIIVCNLDEVFDQFYEDCVDFVENKTSLVHVSSTENVLVPNSSSKKKDLKKLKRYRFQETELFLYNVISEQILRKLDEKKLLDDSTFSLFTEKNTRLR